MCYRDYPSDQQTSAAEASIQARLESASCPAAEQTTMPFSMTLITWFLRTECKASQRRLTAVTLSKDRARQKTAAFDRIEFRPLHFPDAVRPITAGEYTFLSAFANQSKQAG